MVAGPWEELPAARVVKIELIQGRLDWNSRLAALLATTIAAVTAAVWVWLRVSGTKPSVTEAE